MALRPGPDQDRETSTATAVNDPDRSAEPGTPSDGAPTSADETGVTIGDDQRVVALDRTDVWLPVTVGATVEVVGFRPTVTDVEIEVVAARAEVVGVTDRAVLVVMDTPAAHRAGELALVGSLAVLGRDLPDG